MTRGGDWFNSTPAETKVEPFALCLWSQRKTDPNSEMTRVCCTADDNGMSASRFVLRVYVTMMINCIYVSRVNVLR